MLQTVSNSSSQTLYRYNQKIPQDLPVGFCLTIDEYVEEEESIDDLYSELPTLAEDVACKCEGVRLSLRYYAKNDGYIFINKQMRTFIVEGADMSENIRNIYKSFMTYHFEQRVRLFKTEANDYTQLRDGKEITSRKLSIQDTWDFSSFISATVTNQPTKPKVQVGKLSVFVFEFESKQDITGLYLGDEGIKGESEFLLAPAVGKVINAYKLNIRMGYMIRKAKFVVFNLQFKPRPE